MPKKGLDFHLNALIVDRTSEEAKDLIHSLEPEIQFHQLDYTNSLTKALASMQEEPYQLCVISDMYEEKELELFAADILKIGSAQNTLLVLLKDQLPPEFDPESLKDKNIPLVISRKGTAKDKQYLVGKARLYFKGQVIQRKQHEVDNAVHRLITLIDHLAADQKRGKAKNGSALSTGFISDFIQREAEYDPSIMTHYYDKLNQETEHAKPTANDQLDVPDQVLKRDLPHLTKKTYTGASSRVWSKLLNRMGVKGAQTPSLDSTNASAKVETSGNEDAKTEPTETSRVEE